VLALHATDMRLTCADEVFAKYDSGSRIVSGDRKLGMDLVCFGQAEVAVESERRLPVVGGRIVVAGGPVAVAEAVVGARLGARLPELGREFERWP
jgi:hypothetical protein